MKTSKFLIAAITTVAMLVTMGCENNIYENGCNNQGNLSTIARNIQSLKNNGLLDDLIAKSGRNADEDEDYEDMMRFINNTDEVLLEIAASDNGEQDLKIISALFNDGTTDEFAEAFAMINAEKSKEFLDYVNENLKLKDSDDSNLRCVDEPRKIKIQYMLEQNKADRGAYASDMEWSTISWYTGFCAATVAGFYLASYGGFWTRIAGYIAAVAGTSSMVIQLGKWCYCSDLGSFISSLSNNDGWTATEIANTEDGKKIIAICAETTVTVFLCYLAPFGKTVVSAVKAGYNFIVEKILAALPHGVTLLINNKPLKLI